MIARPTPSRRRGGATMVETAVVLTVFLLFIFGIFEYCRFLFMLQMTTNAAREGARYASVNVDKPATFPDTDFTITLASGARTYKAIKPYVNDRMGGGQKQLIGYAVEVFPCDATQMAAVPPVITPKTTATAWNDATFGERIAVRITGTFQPLLPTFLQMPTSIPVSIAVTMGSEG